MKLKTFFFVCAIIFLVFTVTFYCVHSTDRYFAANFRHNTFSKVQDTDLSKSIDTLLRKWLPRSVVVFVKTYDPFRSYHSVHLSASDPVSKAFLTWRDNMATKDIEINDFASIRHQDDGSYKIYYIAIIGDSANAHNETIIIKE